MKYRIISLDGRHLGGCVCQWWMSMSEKVKSNIFEMVVPENLY